MYTRDSLPRNFTVYVPEKVSVPGTVRLTVNKGIPQTWAIARPNSGLSPNGVPYYLGGYRPNQLIRGGSMAVTPARPNVEMDPSDKTTWQRQYLFT